MFKVELARITIEHPRSHRELLEADGYTSGVRHRPQLVIGALAQSQLVLKHPFTRILAANTSLLKAGKVDF